MVRALVRRAVVGFGVVLGVASLTFFLLRAAPGDPVERLIGPNAPLAQVEAQRRLVGLDRPLPEQYLGWLGRTATGDWGMSIARGRPVIEVIGTAWPPTVLLVGLSLALSYLFGIVVGAIQASTSGSRLDTGLSLATVTVYALPGYWLGLMLVMVFTYWLRALPAFGAAGLDADFLTGWPWLVDRLRHLVLPLLTLTLIGIGGAARYMRGAMLDVMGEPFIAVAKAKGLTNRTVAFRHVLRNALVPLFTLFGLSFPALFSGAVFVEAVFAWPGVGRVLVEAVQARDYPVVMAATTVSAILVVVGNLVADVLMAWTDPRMRRA